MSRLEDFTRALADHSFRTWRAGVDGDFPPSLTDLTASITALVKESEEVGEELAIADLKIEVLQRELAKGLVPAGRPGWPE